MRPKLTPSPEYIAAIRAEPLSNTPLSDKVKAAVAAAPRMGMAQLWTYSAIIEVEAKKATEKGIEADKKTNQPWTLAGVPHKVWLANKKKEKDAAKLAKSAEEAAAAAAKAAAVAAPLLPVAKVPKKRAAVAELLAAPPVAAAAPPAVRAVARAPGKRAVKRRHDEMD